MDSVTLPRVSAVILAGGKSQRMGRNKAFIEFGGKPLIARVVERVRDLGTEVIIVANAVDAYVQFGTRVVSDVYPGKGSLGGIYSGLVAAREEYVLAVACDMPFLNAAVLRYLISLAPPFDVVIPRAPISHLANRAMSQRSSRRPWRSDKPIAKGRNLHPFHAVYSKRCLEPMRARLLADDLRAISFLDSVRVRVVEQDETAHLDPKHLSFFNANMLEDLQIASQLGNQTTS
jgi:molybdopterin-guanine dinucleotide biosynthesis protein A